MKKNRLIMLTICLTVLSLLATTASAAGYDVATVEMGVLDSGQPDVDILIDSSDVPHIAYYRYSLSELGYASNPGTGWATETPGLGGDGPSLAIDPVSGYPSITHGAHEVYTAGDTEIRRSYYDGTSWNTEAVDDWIAGLSGTSHAFDSLNRPAAAFINGETLDAVYAYLDGTWTSIIIASGVSDVAPSLGFTPSGDPAVAYCAGGASPGLIYSWYDGSTWNPSVVASGTIVGIDLEFTPAGQPAISCYDEGSNLLYAVFDGSVWNIETALPFAVGQTSDLEFDAAGYPVICCQGEADLFLQRWDGAAWQTETVLSGGGMSDGPALDFLSDGRAMIVAGNSIGDVLVFTEHVPTHYYVDINNGTDDDAHGLSAGTGAWKTMHYAVSRLLEGDTLHVAAGTYAYPDELDGEITIVNDNITIQGAVGGGSIIQGDPLATYWLEAFTALNVDNLLISDLQISNFTTGVVFSYVTNSTIQRCGLHDNNSGIYFDNCDNTNAAIRNKIHDNLHGIQIYASGYDCSPAIINNLINIGAVSTGIVIEAFGSGGTSSPAIYHNTLVGGGEPATTGISMHHDVDTVAPNIYYNIINGLELGVAVVSGAPTPSLGYNDVYDNVTNYDGVGEGTGCSHVDPFFIDAAGDNYELSPGSPCVDAASGSTINIDFKGIGRPQGLASDIGCYELVAASPPPVPGITVTPADGLITDEGGGSDTFTVVLDTSPGAEVTIALSSSDTGEGTVSPESLTFTSENWSTPQTVTVTGVDDGLNDGDIAYTVIVAPAVSEDGNYSGLDGSDVGVTNTDDDYVGIIVTPTSGLLTSRCGGSDTFTIVLCCLPVATVEIALSSSDPDSGIVSPEWLTFTTENGNIPQTVTVTGQDNGIEGDVLYTIITAPAVSEDAEYDGLDPEDVSVTNVDNLPANQPQYVYPEPSQIFAPGSAITLQGSFFSDPEGDAHEESWWRIGRADRSAFGCGDYPAFYEHLSGSDLEEYTIPTQWLTPGVLYVWIVGYRDAGSGLFTWSNINEKYKNTFMIGSPETAELPPASPGTEAADFVMLSCQHYILDNPHASAGSSLCRQGSTQRAYSVLLPVGFALPPLLPAARCALAAPFRPCRDPGSCPAPPGGLFSVALSLGSPQAGVTRHRRSAEPGLSSKVSPRGCPGLWHARTLANPPPCRQVGREGTAGDISMEPARTNDFDMNRPTIISLLYLGSFLAGITSIIGVILAYVWNGESHDSWEDSHYRYHIRTFWIGIAYTILATIGSFVTLFLLAWAFYGAVAVWFAVRGVKSLLAAQKHEPIANVESWLF